MSQRPPAEPCEDDEISLAVAFQGLHISVVGPASKALDFVRKLAPDQPAQSSSSNRGVSSTTSSSSVKGAWICGLHAKAQLESRPPPTSQVVSIDLPAKYFVVLRGKGVSEPTTLRSYVDYKKAFTGRGPPEEVGCEFPSETEARAYLTAAGFGFYAGV